MKKRSKGILKQRLRTCDLAAYVKKGLGALGNHRDVILEASRSIADGSLGFDEVVPNAPTFDYLIGVPAVVLALEVHPAQTHEVPRIVEKKQRTQEFLSKRGCSCSIDRWCWAPTRGVHLRTATRARLLLAQNAIDWPVGQLDLRRLAAERA